MKPDIPPVGVALKEAVIWLEGAIRDLSEANRVIAAINVLKEFLPKEPLT